VLGRDQDRDGIDQRLLEAGVLPAGGRGLDCGLYHAAQVKALPGRPKTDKLDSVWLAKITERGALPGSFVPPEEIRRLRIHTRYRRHLTQARTAEKARVEKLLEDAQLTELLGRPTPLTGMDLRHPPGGPGVTRPYADGILHAYCPGCLRDLESRAAERG
jgi:transposase